MEEEERERRSARAARAARTEGERGHVGGSGEPLESPCQGASNKRNEIVNKIILIVTMECKAASVYTIRNFKFNNSTEFKNCSLPIRQPVQLVGKMARTIIRSETQLN